MKAFVAILCVGLVVGVVFIAFVVVSVFGPDLHRWEAELAPQAQMQEQPLIEPLNLERVEPAPISKSRVDPLPPYPPPPDPICRGC